MLASRGKADEVKGIVRSGIPPEGKALLWSQKSRLGGPDDTLRVAFAPLGEDLNTPAVRFLSNLLQLEDRPVVIELAWGIHRNGGTTPEISEGYAGRLEQVLGAHAVVVHPKSSAGELLPFDHFVGEVGKDGKVGHLTRANCAERGTRLFHSSGDGTVLVGMGFDALKDAKQILLFAGTGEEAAKSIEYTALYGCGVNPVGLLLWGEETRLRSALFVGDDLWIRIEGAKRQLADAKEQQRILAGKDLGVKTVTPPRGNPLPSGI